MANRNKIKTKALLMADKEIKQKITTEKPVKTTIKLAVNRNTKIRIKKS